MTQAQDLMRVPIARMLFQWPLFGAIIASWEIVADNTVHNPTVAIGLGRSGLRLYVNSQFIMNITLDQTIAVLHHEVRHVIYGHIFQHPASFDDPRALTIAQEVTVNEGLPGRLPGKPIRLSQFPQLPRDEDTLTRYRRLERSSSVKIALDVQADSPSDPSNVTTSGSASVVTTDQMKVSPPHTIDPQNAPPSAQSGPYPSDSSPKTLDSHDRWGEFESQEALIRQQVEATVHRVQDARLAGEATLDPTEIKILESILAQGADPGHSLSRVGHDGRAVVNWRHQLRHWIGSQLKVQSSCQQPPRRYPHLVGVVPGKRRLPRRPRILVAIDTSGSVSDAQLADFSAEIAKLAQGREIWVAEVDCTLHRLYRYKGRISVLAARGGTSFLPIFEPSVLSRVRPDLVVYLSDGMGDAPDRAPRVQVLWVLTPEGVSPSSWGHVIRLDHQNS